MADSKLTPQDLESLSEFLRLQEKLRAETKEYSESWSDVQRKIVASINPVTNLQKKINKLSEERIKIEGKLKDLEQYKTIIHDDVYKEIQKSYIQELKNNTQKQKSLEKQNSMHLLIYDTVKKMVELYNQYDKLLSDNAKLQGTNKDEIDAQYSAIQKINKSTDVNRLSNQEILATITEIRKEYSAIAGEALVKIADGSAAIARSTGLSVTESSKFFQTMAEIAGASLQSQKNMEGVANLAAKAAGVPLGVVIKDVANASANVRLIFKGNTTELIKQAAELRKIGSSLDSAAKSAESLLNFESSVGAELKASALLGKNVNFNESRRLFFAGKTAEAEKALQTELRKVGDLDKLKYFQKKALAELTGKDFSELQKMETTRKSLLEAEQEFPELAQQRRDAEAEFAKYQKSASEKRKEELATLLKKQVAETQSKQLEEARAEALNNIGKILKPVGDIITKIQLLILRFIGGITNFSDNWGKITVAVVAGAISIYGAFKLLKSGLTGLLEFAAKGLDKLGESLGSGIGKGLKQLGGGIRSMANSLDKVKPAQIVKMAVILGIITLAVFGLAKAFSMLKDVSGEQMMAFTASLVILGATLLIFGAALIFPPLQLGFILFAAGMLAIGLAAMEFGFAMKMAGPAVESIGETLTSLADTIGGVIVKAFDTMLSVFTALPEVIASVAVGLVTIANIGFFKLSRAAAGIAALSLSIKSLGENLVNLQVDRFAGLVSQVMMLSESAEGLAFAVNSLKELSGIELPKLDMDLNGSENLLKMSELKEKQTNELKTGMDEVVKKLDTLTSLMANGGIAVNIDGQLVSRQLATTRYRSGGFAQATS